MSSEQEIRDGNARRIMSDIEPYLMALENRFIDGAVNGTHPHGLDMIRAVRALRGEIESDIRKARPDNDGRFA